MAHTHEFDHAHNTTYFAPDAGGTASDKPQRANPHDAATSFTQQSSTPVDRSTGSVKTTTDQPSTSVTSNQGSGGDNLHPTLAMAPYIRFRLGPTDTIQTLPISWGRVNGQWRLDTVKNFPASVPENRFEVINSTGRPEGVVKVSATSGTESGTSSENKIIGIMPLPYNFRRFKTKALRVRTRVEMTGGGANATLTLRVNDPVNAGSYLATTDSRITSGDSSTYVDLELTAADLGPDWRPGYGLRFEVLFEVPKTFTTLDLYVGKLDIGIE